MTTSAGVLLDEVLGTLLPNLLVVGGLLMAVVHALRLLRSSGSAVLPGAGTLPESRLRDDARVLMWVPLGLIWLGFVSSGTFQVVRISWALAVAALVGAGLSIALWLLRQAHSGERSVDGAALATLLCTTTLALTGALLAVRLVVAADPTAGIGDTFAVSAFRDAVSAIVLPFAVLLVLLGGLALLVRRPSVGVRALFARPARWVTDGTRRFAGSVGRQTTIVPELVLFAAAVLPVLGGGPRLTVGPLATPEYGKVLYLWILAGLLGTLAVLMRPEVGYSPLRRAVWRPLVPFLLFAVGCGLRSDLGPLIPLFGASLAMLWSTLYAEASFRTPPGQRPQIRQTMARSARPLIVPAAGIVAVFAVAFLTMPYIQQRVRVWHEPWIYHWDSPCQTPPATAEAPDLAGLTVCQESVRTYLASRASQISQSLSAIADGGLWGRGLGDTATGRIPAGSTDFVLAVVWNKLGGLAVLATAALTVVLAVALVRLRRSLRPAPQRADRARLVVAGVAGMLVTQYAFVFAATLNLLPHSGITAPLLSRGGQSTLAVLVAIVLAVGLCYRGRTPDPVIPRRTATAVVLPPASRDRLTGALVLAMAVFVLLTATVVVRPYSGHAENLPLCTNPYETVDPDQCSTDKFRAGRTSVNLVLGGRVQYERRSATDPWRPVGTPDLTPADLAGVIDDDDGGLVDSVFVQQAGGNQRASLAGRVMPPMATGARPVRIELTLDPALQRAAATALDSDDAAGTPLAGGAVVLDPRDGRVLAVASSPPATTRPAPRAEDDDEDPAAQARRRARDAYNAREDTSGYRQADGRIEVRPDDCAQNSPDEVPTDCWQWVASDDTPPSRDDAALRRYVDDLPGVRLPSAAANRATGSAYGPGSTFKVVVAAAYLRRPGTGAADRIDAPTEIPRAGSTPLRNANKGPCPGTGSDGRITLTTALAVSCNTALVRLAEEIGWPAIRDTAVDLGFATPDRPANFYAGPPFGRASEVPVDDSVDGLGTLVLGGGSVRATPLQMASVFGAVADDGVAVPPRLSAPVQESGPGRARRVLTPDQAGELEKALSRTVGQGDDGPAGTAAKLVLPTGLSPDRVRVKTGTNELYPEGKGADPDQFVRQIAWLGGSVDTPEGPLAFAVAVETRDERRGSARARSVTEQLLNAIVEARG